MLGILDDHSRLCCHLQWYLAEGARELCHGLSQAFQKRDLPRSLLFDNGSAMIATETQAGLTRLGIVCENTLPYSPYQAPKAEDADQLLADGTSSFRRDPSAPVLQIALAGDPDEITAGSCAFKLASPQAASSANSSCFIRL